MTFNPIQTAYNFRHCVTTLSASLAVLMMHAIPVSAQEIVFSPGQMVPGQNIGEFQISPDGTQVALVATLDNGLTAGQQTFVAGVLDDGANPATLVTPSNSGDVDGGVRWTPDGLSVITRYDMGVQNEIYLVPADGSQVPQQLSFNSDLSGAFDPQVSSDGSSLFYSDGGSLFVTPIVGASATSAIRLNPPVAAGEISEIDTGDYAQVGSDIIFAGFTVPVPDADNGTRETTFYRTAADGSTANSPVNIPITNLPDDPALNFGRFQVTADGETIIFQGDLRFNGVTELYSMSTAGGDFTLLFELPLDEVTGESRLDFDVNLFKVSNDGSKVLFVSDFLTNGIGEAFVVSTAGGTPVRVSASEDFTVDNGLDVAFTGVPDRLQFSPDDQFAYYVADGGPEGDHDSIFTLHRVPVPALVLLGDVDLSGTVDFADIAPFIALLSGNTFQAEADVDESGVVNFADIAPFIAILSGS